MCGRFDTSGLNWQDIHAALEGLVPVSTAALNLEPNPDVRPTTPQLTARIEDGVWTLQNMHWGLVPFWRSGKPVKDSAKGANDGFKLTTFNARLETVASSAVFKQSFARRRCLAPASAWFEWTGDPKNRIKHRLDRTDGGAIWFAGIWDSCETPDQGLFSSFSILTTASEGWMSAIHGRAPVVLEPNQWAHWLSLDQDPVPMLQATKPDRFALKPA